MSEEPPNLLHRLLDAYDDYRFRLAVWWHRPPRRSERLDRLLDARDDFFFRLGLKWERFRERFDWLGRLLDPVWALFWGIGYWWYHARQRYQWLNRLLAPFDAAAFRLGLWWYQVVPRKVQLWVQSRHRRHFYRGLPALVALAVLLVVAGGAQFLARPALLQRYRVEAANAYAEEDWQTARTCYERLLALGDDPEHTCLSLARTLERQGEFAYAAVLWQRLAPGDQPGYVPAHLARARELLDKPQPGVAARRGAERQLQLALEAIEQKRILEPPEWVREELRLQELEALTRLGELYFHEQDHAKAKDHLVRALQLETPPDLVSARIEFSKPVVQAPRAHAVLGMLYVKDRKEPNRKEAEVHLRIAADTVPVTDPDWLELQGLAGRIYVDSEIHEMARPILERAVAAGRPPEPAGVEVHALLGQVYMVGDQIEEAEEQFRRALDVDRALKQPPQRATVEALTYLGQILLNKNRYAEAEPLLDRAARLRPLDGQTAILAQMLLGKLQLLDNRPGEARLSLAEAVRAGIPNPKAVLEAHSLLGQVYLLEGDVTQAEAHLRIVIEARAELGLALGKSLLRLGKKVEADQYARRAMIYFRERAEANLYDQEARLQWAEALVFLGRYDDALAALSRVLDALSVPAPLALLNQDWGTVVVYVQHAALAARQTPVYRGELSRFCLAGLADAEWNERATPSQRLTLLERALLYEPRDWGVLGRLLRAAQAKGEERQRLRAEWQDGLTGNTSPILSRILLACDALAQGKAAEARPLLDEALRRGPNAAVAVNNLALVLAGLEAVEAPRALALMDAVLAQFPGQPNFLDTRGHILVKLGRWDAARADLAAALPGLSNKQAAHRTLAEVYKQLGDPAKAAEHARLAEKQ